MQFCLSASSFLEVFDYSVGILLPFLGKEDKERRVIINTIGPFGDGNEVWVLTAGGAIFAAFPNWYATMFNGFYMALALILAALILRGVGFEFRSKSESKKWRNTWDRIIFFGSIVPAILWGVAIANLVRGLPIDADMIYQGTFFTLLSPYTILGGLVTLSIFTMHRALFLTLKADESIAEKSHDLVLKLWIPTIVIVLGFVGYSYFETDIFTRLGINPGMAAVTAASGLLAAGWLARARMHGGAFALMGIAIAATVDAPILLLDDLTANLDALTEVAIMRTLLRTSGNRTLLLIMHRLVHLEAFDQIIVLEQGRITEKGIHAQLLTNNDHYARVYRKQAGSLKQATVTPAPLVMPAT